MSIRQQRPFANRLSLVGVASYLFVSTAAWAQPLRTPAAVAPEPEAQQFHESRNIAVRSKQSLPAVPVSPRSETGRRALARQREQAMVRELQQLKQSAGGVIPAVVPPVSQPTVLAAQRSAAPHSVLSPQSSVLARATSRAAAPRSRHAYDPQRDAVEERVLQAIAEQSHASPAEPQTRAPVRAAPPAMSQPPPPAAIPSPWPAPSAEEPQPPAASRSHHGEDEPGSLKPGEEVTERTKRLVTVTGGYRLSAGATRGDFILNDANGDYNERNFRMISPAFLQENTYDPAIYSRVWFDIDGAFTDTWSLHTKLVADPWSWTGTTKQTTVVGADATDQVALQLKYWGNTNRMINEVYWTENVGDTMALPEIEVDDGHTVRTRVTSNFSNTYVIPELEIDYSFQPVRELWVDYATDITQLRLFPMAYENQSLTSDDPLQLSNHHTYWQWSPWIEQWQPGHRLERRSAPVVNAFVRGQWSHDLAFFTRDSDLQRLTALRGATLLWNPSELTSMQAGIASPKTLWQDYGSWNEFVGMVRPKYQLLEQLTLGGVYTTRWGYNESVVDAYNHVFGWDTEWTPLDWLKFEAEGASSFSGYDRTQLSKYDLHGWMWHAGLQADKRLGSHFSEAEKESGEGQEPDMLGGRLFYTHMDESFDPGLANYHETRDDAFWGRHISFHRPLPGYQLTYIGGDKKSGALAGIMPFKIGDGVDAGRDVIGVRLTSRLFDGAWESLYDYRNVHATSGKFIEDVIRTEQTWHPTLRLTGKFLFLYHHLPDTLGGIDPLLFDTTTLIKFNNAAVPNDQNPSVMTFGSGVEYFLLEDLSAWVAWEITQDEGLGASDSYPRGLFNATSLPLRFEGDQQIRYQQPFLYDQGIFPRAPYPWFHVFKVGTHWQPSPKIVSNFSWTRNTDEFAGQINQSMNHINAELEYHPLDRLTLLGRYTWSESFDLPRINDTGGADIEYTRHSNMYVRALYQVTANSEFSCEFGVGSFASPYQIFTTDPTGEYYPVLDTQMIVRLAYTAKF